LNQENVDGDEEDAEEEEDISSDHNETRSGAECIRSSSRARQDSMLSPAESTLEVPKDPSGYAFLHCSYLYQITLMREHGLFEDNVNINTKSNRYFHFTFIHLLFIFVYAIQCVRL
jgi:hypothetical protein